jgi:integrase/recombinase XerD
MERIQNIPVSIKFLLEGYPKKIRASYPLYARIIVNRKKALISLKMNVDPDEWDFDLGLLKTGKQFNLVRNNKLREVDEKIAKLYSELKNSGLPINITAIKRALKGDLERTSSMLFKDYFSQHIEQLRKRPAEYGEGVLNTYLKTQNHLLSFLKANGWQDFKMHQLSRNFIERFENYLLSTPNLKTGRIMNGNTSTTYCKKIKSSVNAAIRQGVINSNPFYGFKIKSFKNVNKVVLTDEELEVLQNHALADNLSLQRVRDIFIFCCNTGLRYSDAKLLKTDMIKEDREGVKWISLKQQKTSDNVEIPLSVQAVKIYNKYEDHRLSTSLVLPVISSQRTNSALKVIAELTGLNKRITFHCSRHTFATISLELGMDLKTVSALMGHSSISSTEVYGKITRKRKAEAIKLLNR